MKIDKDDLYIYGLISGLIICSPFLGVYYGAKWIYNHNPQKVKEKKIKTKINKKLLKIALKMRFLLKKMCFSFIITPIIKLVCTLFIFLLYSYQNNYDACQN